MSSLLHKTAINPDISPWQAFVINGTEKNSDKVTWILVRSHNLLKIESIFPELPIRMHLNPWGDSQGILHLFTAPSATQRLFTKIITVLTINITQRCMNHLKTIYELLGNILTDVFVRILSLKDRHLENIVNLSIVSLFASITITNVRDMIYATLLYLIRCSFKFFCKISIYAIIHLLRQLCEICVYIIRIVLSLFRWMNRVRRIRSPFEEMVVDAILETYWVIRAMVSLPRLVMEELIASWRVVPLNVWSGYRRPQNFQVTWGEKMPVQLVEDVRNRTGASFNSVLLTAASVAVTALLKFSGMPLPSALRCTVPVSASLNGKTKSSTLLPIAFPTNSINSAECLDGVRRSLRQLRRYPERYLVSSWILKYGPSVLPNKILVDISTLLTGRYPLLCSYITAPNEPMSLYEHQVVSMFHLRHPVQEAGEIKKKRTELCRFPGTIASELWFILLLLP